MTYGFFIMLMNFHISPNELFIKAGTLIFFLWFTRHDHTNNEHRCVCWEYERKKKNANSDGHQEIIKREKERRKKKGNCSISAHREEQNNEKAVSVSRKEKVYCSYLISFLCWHSFRPILRLYISFSYSCLHLYNSLLFIHHMNIISTNEICSPFTNHLIWKI